MWKSEISAKGTLLFCCESFYALRTTRSRIGKWGLDSSVENLYQFFLFTISQGMFRVTCKYEGDGVEERVGGNRHVKCEYHWVQSVCLLMVVNECGELYIRKFRAVRRRRSAKGDSVNTGNALCSVFWKHKVTQNMLDDCSLKILVIQSN